MTAPHSVYIINGILIDTTDTEKIREYFPLFLHLSLENKAGSVFETLRTYNGQLLWFDEYLERLQNSIDLYHIKPLTSLQSIRHTVEKNLQKKAHSHDWRIRIVVNEEIYAVILTPIPLFGETEPSTSAETLEVNDVKYTRTIPRAKYIDPITYQYFARTRPETCKETLLFSPDNFLREGTICNVFAVSNNILITPEKDILLGITRKRIIECARGHNIALEIREISHRELAACDEIFVTSSIRGTISIHKWNDWTSKTTTTADQMRKAFWQKIAENLRLSHASISP